ncbi:MAG: exo-alpha-sialidase [Chitinophagaceae bacterium]|nr:exo-alpha-sialidase [Chitinophagaceae bacterium]
MKKILPLFVIVFSVLISCTQSRVSSENILLSDAGNNASCVYLTNDPAGVPAVSWVEIDSSGTIRFFVALWNSENNSFGEKVNIPIPQNTILHDEAMPKVNFKGDGTLVATFEVIVPPVKGAKRGKGDILFALSTDNGKTWTEATSVNSGFPYEGSIGYSGVKRLTDGELGFVWLGTNPESDEGRPILFAKTTKDGGFTKPILIDTIACECCRVAITNDKAGELNIVFRDLLPGSIRDISIATSDNNGDTFNKPVTFSDDQWVIGGCPDNGPSVAANAQTTYTAWFAGSSSNQIAGIYYGELNKNHELLSKRLIAPAGKFTQICLMPDGTRIMGYNEAYRENDSAYYKVFISKINDDGYFKKEVTLPRSYGFFPVVVPAGNNLALIAWRDRGKVFYSAVSTEDISKAIPEISYKNTSQPPKEELMPAHMTH